MPSIKAILQSGLVLAVLLLSGCASLAPVFSPAERPPAEAAPTAPESLEKAVPALSPLQQKVLALRAKPNLYLSAQPPLAAKLKTQFQQAQAAIQRADYAQAEKLLTRLNQTQPKLSGPWLLRGDMWLHQAQRLEPTDWQQREQLQQQARQAYQHALQVNHLNYHAHNRLGSVYRQLGEFALAQRHYRQALSSWPAFASAYLNLGMLHDLYLGDKQQALEYYQLYQALQDKPQRQVRGWIADLQRQLAQQPQGAN